MTTTENFATCWRDLTDQLSPADIALQESDEASGFAPEVLLFNARESLAPSYVGELVYGAAWWDMD